MDEILKEAKKYADNILNQHRAELEILVEELMEKGILSRVELEQIFDDSSTSLVLAGGSDNKLSDVKKN